MYFFLLIFEIFEFSTTILSYSIVVLDMCKYVLALNNSLAI